MTDKTTIPAGLAKMREAFPVNQIGKLPKESKKQREERENPHLHDLIPALPIFTPGGNPP